MSSNIVEVPLLSVDQGSELRSGWEAVGCSGTSRAGIRCSARSCRCTPTGKQAFGSLRRRQSGASHRVAQESLMWIE